MGLFGRKPKRGMLESLLEKQQKREFKESRAREGREKKEEARKRKLEKIGQKTEYYSAVAKRRRAKHAMREAGGRLPALPSLKVKVRKKKQGGKLSRKRRIGLI